MGEILMEKNRFKKVMSSTDILVVAFGAMIGWGWVVSSGRWIQNAGVLDFLRALQESGGEFT